MQVIENSFRHDNCPLCNSHSIDEVGVIKYNPNLYYSTINIRLTLKPELWHCKNCGSSFAQNVIPEGRAIELYQQGTADERWVSTTFQESKTDEVIDCLKSLLEPQQRVLDVGCAGGSFLDFAKENGCLTFGVEYSLDNLDTLKAKGHIAYGGIESSEGLFDLITAFDVIEHLYEPAKFLEMCLERLAPNGSIVFLTGDISCTSAKFCGENWWYAKFPEHIVFPSIHYFSSHPMINVSRHISTQAGKSYECSLPIAILKNINNILRYGHFSACPSLSGGDHFLVVLQSK